MEIITPVDVAPAGFTLGLIDMSAVLDIFPDTVLADMPNGYLHGKTAWFRQNTNDPSKADVIPLFKDGDWNGTYHIIEVAFVS